MAGAEQGSVKCRADGKRQQWTTVSRGAVDQGSAAMERQWRHRQWAALAAAQLCAGSQDSGGTGGSASLGHGRGFRPGTNKAGMQGTGGALGRGGSWLKGMEMRGGKETFL